MICTPAYGGNVRLEYFNSCMALQKVFHEIGMDATWLTTGNESLVTRARNTAAAQFMQSHHDYLMFIDADIHFEPDDVARLWNLANGDPDNGVPSYPVVCAAYSMKRPDKPLSAWKDGKLLKIEEFDAPTSVDYAGTGFLLIHRRVFEQMQEAHPEWKHEEGYVGECWAYFDTAVEDGIYLSEDYYFCKRWRELGGEIILDPSIRLGHVGSFEYR